VTWAREVAEDQGVATDSAKAAIVASDAATVSFLLVMLMAILIRLVSDGHGLAIRLC
jgi:hypothetical protein